MLVSIFYGPVYWPHSVFPYKYPIEAGKALIPC
jgi:hypothetical protein